MTPAHKLFLGFAVVLIAVMFLVASRAEDEAEVDYHPPRATPDVVATPPRAPAQTSESQPERPPAGPGQAMGE